MPFALGDLVDKDALSTEVIPAKFNFQGTVWPHPYFSSTINDIFRKLDLAVNGVLSAQELNQFGKIVNERLFMDIREDDFTSEAFEDISCSNEGVSLLGFKQLLFRNFNNSEITGILKKLGYDECLNSLKSRVIVMSFLSSEELTVKINDAIENNFHNKAFDTWLEHLSVTIDSVYCKEKTDDYLVQDCYYGSEGTNAAKFINTSDSEIVVKADFSESYY